MRVNLTVHAGEIVGIAGVSGNGQSELVEVLAGQRAARRRRHLRRAASAIEPARDEMRARSSVRCLPEEPLQQRLRRRHDGGREHGLPHLRPRRRSRVRLVAVSRGADARATRAS